MVVEAEAEAARVLPLPVSSWMRVFAASIGSVSNSAVAAPMLAAKKRVEAVVGFEEASGIFGVMQEVGAAASEVKRSSPSRHWS